MQFDTITIFAITHLLAAASPGPNFFLVSNLAGRESRLKGLSAALGITLSVLVWSSVAALGFNVFLQQNPAIYNLLRYAGAAYLVWLGLKMIVGAISGASRHQSRCAEQSSAYFAVLQGFLVNVGNPKTLAYYTSVFAVLVPPGSNSAALSEVILVAVAVSFTWWCVVALAFSNLRIKKGFARIRTFIEIITGGAFVILGLRLATP